MHLGIFCGLVFLGVLCCFVLKLSRLIRARNTPDISPKEKILLYFILLVLTPISAMQNQLQCYISLFKIHKWMLGKNHSFENLVKQKIMKVEWEECLWYLQQSSCNNRDYSLPGSVETNRFYCSHQRNGAMHQGVLSLDALQSWNVCSAWALDSHLLLALTWRKIVCSVQSWRALVWAVV